jgi:uncharacterized protein (TIGR02646 family)
VRPIDRGPSPVDDDGQPIKFSDYGDAQRPLIDGLGGYCSYCGMRLDTSVHVEHVRPKSKHAHLRLTWDNFLLACVHCNSTKSAEDIVVAEYCWPDCDNPMMWICYGPDALVRAVPNLDPAEHDRALRTLELVGLDRVPGATRPPSAKDRRWKMREEAWRKAHRALGRLRRCDTTELREQIIEAAICDGYWAVWYAAFAADRDLRRRLIRAARGTCVACFDDSGAPTQRPKPAEAV